MYNLFHNKYWHVSNILSKSNTKFTTRTWWNQSHDGIAVISNYVFDRLSLLCFVYVHNHKAYLLLIIHLPKVEKEIFAHDIFIGPCILLELDVDTGIPLDSLCLWNTLTFAMEDYHRFSSMNSIRPNSEYHRTLALILPC